VDLRERVRRAVSAEVDRSEGLLAEAAGAPADERLLLYLGGWFRGLAAGLEELAAEVDALRPRPEEHEPSPGPSIAPDERLERAERLQAEVEETALPEAPE
jgi:hypothetical protein